MPTFVGVDLDLDVYVVKPESVVMDMDMGWSEEDVVGRLEHEKVKVATGPLEGKIIVEDFRDNNEENKKNNFKPKEVSNFKNFKSFIVLTNMQYYS